MDAFEVLDDVLGDYRSFVQGFLNIRDPRVLAKVDEEIANGLLWPEPWLALNPAFEPGGVVGDLVDEGLLHPACRGIFRHGAAPGQADREISFHRHQADAVRIAARRESYVLTTGTGSGKSLAYIVPIVDRVLRDGSGRGVRGIVVYPMNALANSQVHELEKFLGTESPKVTFKRYTGQERPFERDAILANPPDILLTNYVMLELILTRPRERSSLVASARNLSFLVLDELHTYRGRQGADVAMLIRRLRGAIGVAGVQCVGTSATLAGPGTLAEQRVEVSKLAARLFGTPIPTGNVVGESLRRATEGEPDPGRLRARVAVPPPTDFASLRRDDLAVWIEQTFGLREKEGRLTRQVPTRLRDAAARLAVLTGTDQEDCDRALRATLLAGSRARGGDGRTLFAFKLHQFIGKGDTAYVTLDPPATRYLTTQYQRSAPEGPRGQPLFPLAFCRECGQDYLVVSRERGERFIPRVLTGAVGERPEATGLLLLLDHDWPQEGSGALLDLVPEDWVSELGGARVFDKARRTRLPAGYRVDRFGTITDGGDGLPVAFFETLHFCPACGTSYESTAQSEFSRVGSLGTEGRASAVTVLSQAVVRSLRDAPDLDEEARKFLTFSDNRQDASLQAGHFNDFVLVGLIRSAVYRAALEHQRRYPDEPLTDDDLGRSVLAALGLDITEYAANPEVEYAARQRVTRAMREAVTYRVWADLRRGWRITMPNLEQTGQLELTYAGLGELARDEAKWADAGQPLAGAEPATRLFVMRTLLDELRRNICIESTYLTEDRYEDIKRATQEWLRSPWALTDEQGVYAATCFPGPRPRAAGGVGRDLYLSGLGQYGRWLRRPDRFPLLSPRLTVRDADALIDRLLAVMARVGLLARIEERHRPVGYRIQGGIIEWRAGSGESRAPDPIRRNTAGRVNPYFRRLYAETATGLARLEAREHTAQVPAEKRQERETRFGKAELPVLYCSPTLELGVDIKSLNAVGMRNVPPTPANYAQRSGRAGRSGQPAVVFTYCATGNAHDNYYFGRSRDMVAGAVSPPRLELGNQDLVRAHAHAIWLVVAELDLKASMIELLDVELADQPLRDTVLAKIHSQAAASRAVQAVRAVLLATPEVTGAAWWREDWIETAVREAPARFERAFDRWRGLYREAQAELDAANEVLKTIGASEPDKQRARGQISEARAALDLLRGDIDDINHGDFYTYRYFASEGFLPGYSFPRLPLAAFIPAERRTRHGQGDYVQRPRFLAISEFGPQSFIYHEGARYEVTRVSLPARDDGTGVNLTEAKRCDACGYLHDSNGQTSHEVCEHCGSVSLTTMTRMMRLLAVKTRRRDRISADEEERQRAGHEITTAIRFEPYGERSSRLTSRVVDADGTELATLHYGDTALIRRMNVGFRRRKDKDLHGYLLDTVDGRWVRSTDQGPVAGPDGRVQRVVPYVEDHRNALLVELAPRIPAEQRMAVMYALKRAIEVEFQLESNELAAEPMPGRTGDHAWSVLLLFEAAEGGAGVLRRLATEPWPIRSVARRAIELLHYDPDTGADRGRAEHATELCAQACYDCLLSYSNQWDHQALDRHVVIGLLTRLTGSTVEPDAWPGEDRAARFARLDKQCNGLERSLLRFLYENGHRLPDEAQQTVEGYYVRPDFTFRLAGGDVAVFVDGPVHHDHHQAGKDEQARTKLEDELGWLVLRFHHEDNRSSACGDPPSWQDIVTGNPHVFGPGRAGR